MSKGGVLCPYCRRGLLGYRRQNGSIAVKASMTLDDGHVTLVCPDCGQATLMLSFAPVLVPMR